MNVSKKINCSLTVVLIFFGFGCANIFESLKQSTSKLSGVKGISSSIGDFKIETKESTSAAQIFIDVHDLGRRYPSSSFNEFLGHIPDGKWKSRVYLARIDDLPIGKGYGELNKWDMALETGFIDGLIRKVLPLLKS